MIFFLNPLLVASVFTDGRFNVGLEKSNFSYFQNISCSDSSLNFAVNLAACTLYDKCQSICEETVGLKCFGMVIN